MHNSTIYVLSYYLAPTCVTWCDTPYRISKNTNLIISIISYLRNFISILRISFIFYGTKSNLDQEYMFVNKN